MPGDKRQDQRFLHTVQVRVRKKNPLIERREGAPAEPHIDDDPTAAVLPPSEAAMPEPQVEAPMPDENSELGSSIYDRIEHTDRSEELAEAEAELESALAGLGPESADALLAAVPKEAPALEDTRTYLGPAADTAPDRKPPAASTSTPTDPTPVPAAPRPAPRADAGRPAKPPRPSGERPAPKAEAKPPRPSGERPAVKPPRPSDERPAAKPPHPSGERPAPKAETKRPADPSRAVTTIAETAAPVPAPPPAPSAPAAAPPEPNPKPTPAIAADRAPTLAGRPAPAAKDPTTRGRRAAARTAMPRRPAPDRVDTEPTPVEPAPRVAALLDDDETVLASEPPRAGRHWSDNEEPGIRLVRRAEPAAKPPRAPVPQPRPRERLALLGTDAAGEVMKEHALQALGGALPEISNPMLRLMRGELSEATMGVLEGMFEGRFDPDSGDASASVKRALERLVNDRQYGNLTPKEQASLLRAVAAAPGDATTIKAAIALIKTGVGRNLPQTSRQSLLHFFSGLDAEARVRVAQLAARRLRNRSALEDRDLQDQPLVHHLEHLVAGKGFSEALTRAGTTRKKCVSMVLGAIAHPERLSFEEGSAGVLGMLEFGLADTAPAELGRLWRHLAFDDMTIPLAQGAMLELGPRLAQRPSEDEGPLAPLRLALSGLAELARPGRSRKSSFIMPGGHGIDADVVSRALELLFGFGFTVAAGATNAMRHLARVPQTRHRLPPVFVTVLYSRGERLFLYDHQDEDWVYLRAPRGRSTKQRGALRVDPRREVVDPERGLDRIPKEAFEEKVGVGLIPRL